MIDGVRKFVNVRDLDIDLIDSINPFDAAYAVLAKAMDEKSLRQVQTSIAAKKVSIPEEEARELSKRALQFKNDRGRLPDINSADAWEKRLAEAARLRVIYANGTESNLLRRSLQRALYKDETGRRMTDPDLGPLFGDAAEPDDIESGTIYVLRSLSNHPFVAEHRELIHKIGVTGGKVESRIAAADKDATYLLADVEVIATYKLHNLSRIRLENIFHRLFGAAQLDLTIEDRFGNPVKPREWFLVPLHVIDEAVARIRDGSITDMVYDPETARLNRR